MNTNTPRTWIEINRSALLANIMHLKKLTKNTALGCVVKSNAYGHGILAVSSLLESVPDIVWLFTIGFQEACLLRAHGITKKILALGYADLEYQEAILNNIDIAITDADHTLIDHINEQAQALNKKASVHLKIETGLGRLGLATHEVVPFAQYIKENCPFIDLHGIFTHLSDSNNENLEYTYHQLDTFNHVIDALKQRNINIPCTHALSSGSLSLPYPDKPHYNYATVRIGGNMYGLWKSELQKKRFHAIDASIELEPVLSCKTKIFHIGHHPAGSSIGYMRAFITQRDSIIAILPVGYADGYPRILSNNAHVLVNGILAPVAGIVSMNLMAIDITNVPSVAVGMEVSLIGPHQGITADEMARKAGTITNELLTRINPLIERQIVAQSVHSRM